MNDDDAVYPPRLPPGLSELPIASARGLGGPVYRYRDWDLCGGEEMYLELEARHREIYIYLGRDPDKMEDAGRFLIKFAREERKRARKEAAKAGPPPPVSKLRPKRYRPKQRGL